MSLDRINFHRNRKKIDGKWKLAVMIILYSKPQRFNKIKQLLGEISAMQLTRSIRELENNALVIRKKNSHTTFHLTKEGKDICNLFYKINTILERLPD